MLTTTVIAHDDAERAAGGSPYVTEIQGLFIATQKPDSMAINSTEWD